MRLEYDPALPITAHRVEILEALARHPVIVVCGATGSGKTTQLPKFCLEAGRGTNGLIGHTQPRRIAARALAARLAEEMGTTVDVPGKRKGRGWAVKRLPASAATQRGEAGGAGAAPVAADVGARSAGDDGAGRPDAVRVSGGAGAASGERAGQTTAAASDTAGGLALTGSTVLAQADGPALVTSANSVGLVGYKVRFNDRTGPNTRVKLMTDGILLKELESDRSLRRYDTLIIDEAHERSLNIDLLLGVLKQLSPRRPDLRIIVTSATIDPGKFSNFFGGAPVIEVSGRSYPVEIRYRPLIAEDEDAAELSLPEGIVAAVRELDRNGNGMRGDWSRGSGDVPSGDTLVFLPGEKHIREATEALGEAQLRHTEVLPLFARLSARDQERIFASHTGRRVVLATNVAETSLTVPGIRFVIDSGLARISRYSVRGKVQRLPIERISKASADQRKGRCGREAEGICIRLYSEEDFSRQEDFTPPEVLRTNLASVILRMATLGLGEPESFPFLDPPDTRLVNDGVRLLQELKAMDDQRRVTSLGAKVAGLPVDPRLGRMLLAASHHNCVTEMLAITAFLEVQDPRERPSDAQQQSAEKHALFADARSDFVTVLNLWRAFKEQSAAVSGSQLRKWCREHFLSFLRMREWQELHSQLSQSVRELELRPNQAEASYTDLHQAILTGFLGSIGNLDEKREYDGPRGMRFVIAPGTPLANKPPKWVVAGSLLETTRLYARMVAAVDAGWIESAGAHLLKRTYSEPHWVEGRGFVAAFESVSLYGLQLASRRRVNYGAIAPIEAREIFIREALIGGDDARRHFEGAPSDVAGLRGEGRGAVDDGGEGRGGAGERGAGRGGSGRGGAGAGRDAGGRRRAGANGAIRGDFLHANHKLREEIEVLEAKIRRRDILVDEQAQLEFYAKRLPERVSSVSAFEHWRAGAERENPRVLYMSQADLMQREAADASIERFPDDFPVGANRLPLQYKFEPAEPDDGVTLVVPEPLLDMLQPDRLAWLVPGMRLEKVTAVFRALPKALRKPLVPVPDHAREALAEIEGRTGSALPGFHEWLAQWVTQRAGAQVTAADLTALVLPDHLRMNIRVVDADDRVMTEGRDLAAIRRKLYGLGVVDAGRSASGVGSLGSGWQGAGWNSVGSIASGGNAVGARGGIGGGAMGYSGAGSTRSGASGARGAGSSISDAGRVGSGSNSPGVSGVGRAGSGSTGQGVSGADRLGAGRGVGSGAGRVGPVGSGAGVRGVGHTGPGGGGASRVGPGGSGSGVSVGGRVSGGGIGAGGSGAGGVGAASGPPDAARLHRQWDFGDLPETAEVERNRLRLAVYPAVQDCTVGVALVEARSPADAELISRAGLTRLAMLLLPQQAKYVAKRMADDRELVLLSGGLPLDGAVADALTRRAFRECFLPADQALPRSEGVFATLLESRRAQLNEVADRLSALITSTFKEWRAVRSGLAKLGSPSFAAAVSDINSQLAALLPPDFIGSVPRPWLDYLPRYLKAIGRRIERLPANATRDAELAAKVKPFMAGVQQLVAQLTRPTVPAQLFQLRWMIEEYRVSLFAQELKTPMKVSDKRLAEQLEAARVEARG